MTSPISDRTVGTHVAVGGDFKARFDTEGWNLMAKKSRGTKLKAYSPKAIVSAPPAQRRYILRRFWLPAVFVLRLAAGRPTGIIAAYEITFSLAANRVAALS